MKKLINVTMQIEVEQFKQGLTTSIDTEFIEKLEVIDRSGQVNIIGTEVVDYEVQE